MTGSAPAVLALFVTIVVAGPVVAAQGPPLRIVVLSGEDSVNVIQQKTAVAPLVEVRDRNNNPVSGAVVTFAVQGGRTAAFQGGATTMTIATNAAGQAAATGLTPLTTGAVNISVEAAFQGQIVTAAISQVNVLTAAEAAAAASGASAGGGAGSSAGAAGGGAAGSGGGLSITTVGIIGGVAAAGAVVGTQVLGSGVKYFGGFTMNITMPFGNCSRQDVYAGNLYIELDAETGDTTGSAEVQDGTTTVAATTCTGIGVGTKIEWGMPDTTVSATDTTVTFQSSDVVPSLDGNGITISRVFKFSGTRSGSSMTGTYEMTWTSSQPNFPVMTGRTTVTLTKQ